MIGVYRGKFMIPGGDPIDLHVRRTATAMQVAVRSGDGWRWADPAEPGALESNVDDRIACESHVIREMVRERDAVRRMLGEILGREIDPTESTEDAAREAVEHTGKPNILAYFAEGAVWSQPVNMDEVAATVLRTVEEIHERGYHGGPIPLTLEGLEGVRCGIQGALEDRWPERFAVVIRPERRPSFERKADVMIYPRVHERPLIGKIEPGECTISIDLNGSRS